VFSTVNRTKVTIPATEAIVYSLWIATVRDCLPAQKEEGYFFDCESLILATEAIVYSLWIATTRDCLPAQEEEGYFFDRESLILATEAIVG
jgi:hypothetical protein